MPDNDPTLLLVNAGMVQFKDAFLGLGAAALQPRRHRHRNASASAASTTTWKMSDPAHRHHTFFEMLGNFSFGDYFKEDAIQFAWRLLMDELGLRLRKGSGSLCTQEDDEAERLWLQAGVPPDRVLCASVRRTTAGPWEKPAPAAPALRFTTTGVIWRSRPLQVSMSTTNTWRSGISSSCSTAKTDGTMVELPKPSVDTGAGLERLASILQGHDNNYDTDAFMPIIQVRVEYQDALARRNNDRTG